MNRGINGTVTRRGVHFGYGVGEIRTHGTLSGSAVFKTAALNHSATTPLCRTPPRSSALYARRKKTA